MSGTIVLKKERSKYRYYVQDEAGEVVFTSPFLGAKDRALELINAIIKNDHFETNLQPIQGRDGSWVVRGELNQSREGEKNYSNTVFANGMGDGIKLGYSKALQDESEVQETIEEIVAASSGAGFIDETE